MCIKVMMMWYDYKNIMVMVFFVLIYYIIVIWLNGKGRDFLGIRFCFVFVDFLIVW